MKTNNPLMDTLVESQTQFVNNWMESAKKMQAAFTDGTMSSEGQSFYREFVDKQLAIFNGIKNMGKNSGAESRKLRMTRPKPSAAQNDLVIF